jgi:hypothetical protein
MTIEYIDYTILRQDFSEYQAEEGLVLRMMTLVTDMRLETDENNNKNAYIGTKDITKVLLTKPFDTSQMELGHPEHVTEEDEIRNLEFTPVKEVINIYETKKDLIILTTRVERVGLTNKKDKDGLPILRFGVLTGVNLLDKANLDISSPATHSSVTN